MLDPAAHHLLPQHLLGLHLAAQHLSADRREPARRDRLAALLDRGRHQLNHQLRDLAPRHPTNRRLLCPYLRACPCQRQHPYLRRQRFYRAPRHPTNRRRLSPCL
jgi:hypothetical protein